MFVCRSVIGIGAQTAGPIGTGEVPFDAPEQRKDYGNNFRVTSGMWHVTRAILHALAKKYLAKAADGTNGRIRLKLGVPIASTVRHVPFG